MKQFTLRNYRLAVACLFACTLLHAQTPPCQWAAPAGAFANDAGAGIVTDYLGNVYVTGIFSGSNVDFDPGPGTANLSSNGSTDIFVVKYDAAGAYQWAFNIGGAGADSGNAIALDIYNNVYITGSFTGSNVDFDPGAGTLLLNSNGASDGYLARFTPAGQFLWALSFGGTAADEGFGVAADDSAFVYITGSLGSSNADFDPSSSMATLSTNGGKDIFVAKYDQGGQYAWAFNMGAAGNFNECGYAIATDHLFHIYITGQLDGTSFVDVDPSISTHSLAGGGGKDIFVVKYDSYGHYQWAFGIPGPNDDFGAGICADQWGNVCVTGIFNGNLDFDPGAATQSISSNGADAFVAVYTPVGAYNWAFALGGSTNNDGGAGAHWDSGGNLLATGYFSGSNIDFDPGNATQNLSSNGMKDIYLCKYNSTGQYVWAMNIGDASGDDAGTAVAVDPGTGNIAMTGTFGGTTIDFDPGAAVVALSAAGAQDVFVAQYSSCGSVPPQPLDITGPAIVCNGTTNIYSVAPVPGATSYTWTLPPGWSGNSTGTSITTISSTTSGTITVTADNACGSSPTATLQVTSVPPPVITYTQSPDTACLYAMPFTLSPALPAGGMYNGTGVSGNTFTPTVAGLGYDTVRYFYTDTNGCIGSQVQVIHVLNCVGIPVIGGDDMLQVFPNPFDDQLNVEIAVRSANVMVYNALGARVLVRQLQEGRNTIDTKQFDPGFYLLEIITDTGIIERKMIRR